MASRRDPLDDGRDARSRVGPRRRWYLLLMGLCVLLIVLSWNLVRLWSVPAAVAMSAVAAVLPPIAVIIANSGRD